MAIISCVSAINWGSAPEWGALIVAAIGGGVALIQLRQQQRTLIRELRRGAALEEALLREQAGAVDLAWTTDSARETFVKVTNNSRRPIRGVDCRVVLTANGGVIALPSRAGEMQEKKVLKGSDWILPKDGVAPGEWCNVLRAGGQAGFVMPAPPGPGQRALVRFIDDAGLHWQLDNELHLERFAPGAGASR